MSLIIAGGWVMVPLLLISIIVLALIIDRSLSYIWNPLPDADQQKNILEKIQKGEFAAAETYFSETPWLKNYASALGSSEKMPFYEGVLAENISSLAAMMDKRLPLLATLGRISPLLGLLGTIIGMIQTFPVIAQSRSGTISRRNMAGINYDRNRSNHRHSCRFLLQDFPFDRE